MLRKDGQLQQHTMLPSPPTICAHTAQSKWNLTILHKYSPPFVSLSQSHASNTNVNDLWKEKKEDQLDKKYCYRPHKQWFGISRYCCYKEANWKQFKFSPLYCHVKALEGIFSKAWNITALKTVGQSRLTAKQQHLPPHTKDWIIIFLLPLYLFLSFLSHRSPSQKQLWKVSTKRRVLNFGKWIGYLRQVNEDWK